jgi:hypothetical protein
MYFDAAHDRVDADHRLRVEEVRAGYILARDAKAYAKWSRTARKPSSKPGLVGAALEAAVMSIASIFPDNVQRGTV